MSVPEKCFLNSGYFITQYWTGSLVKQNHKCLSTAWCSLFHGAHGYVCEVHLWVFRARILRGVHHARVRAVVTLPLSVHLRGSRWFRFCRSHCFFSLSNAVEPLLFVEGIAGLEAVHLRLSFTTKHHPEKVLGYINKNRDWCLSTHSSGKHLKHFYY